MRALGANDPQSAGRYRLLAVLGQGAMGRVMLGRAPDGRLVAVKVVHRHLASNPEFRARFAREVAASRRVTGAYTAAVMDADPEAAQPWLASVYVPGPSLRDAIESAGPLPLGSLRLLTAGLAAAMLEIHRAGMIHRDLKPGNVLLGAEGPRVIDFGIARALEAETQLTATGALLGSPAYMSPEQAENRELTPAADVFAVGAILVHAVTGASPFLGASTPQTVYNVVHGHADTSGVPIELRAVVDACLAKDPARRPTPAQLLEAVEKVPVQPGWTTEVQRQIAELRTEAEIWSVTDGRGPKPAGPRRTGRWVYAGAALAVTAAVGAGAAFAWPYGSGGGSDPLAGKTFTLTDDQLRTVDTCALLAPDVLAPVGQPIGTSLVNSSTCTAKLVGGSQQGTITVSVGTVMPTDAKPISDALLEKSVVDTTVDAKSCGRALPIRDRPALGIDVTVRDLGSGGCAAASRGLKAVLARLITAAPQAAPRKQSEVPLDPCAELPQSVADTVAGPGVHGAAVDLHSCEWSGPVADVTVQMMEQRRTDSDPSYRPVLATGGPRSGSLSAARRTSSDGACVSAYVTKSTTGDLAEVVQVTARPLRSTESGNLCGTSEVVLLDVVGRLENP